MTMIPGTECDVDDDDSDDYDNGDVVDDDVYCHFYQNNDRSNNVADQKGGI